MKKIIIALFAVLPLMFLSCDNFKEDEYLIDLQGETTDSTPITKTQDYQAVLLEDYTGWKCVNCPAAAALINDLTTKYGEKLVAMSVHAGSFAKPGASNHNVDFRTSYGDTWNTEFGISAYPSGLINRVINNGTSRVFQKDDWDNEIGTLLSSSTHYLNISLGAKTEEQQGRFIISTKFDFVKDVSFPTLVSVVIVEDSIIGVQLNSNSTYGATPEIDDYVFRHVLRTNGRIDLSLKSGNVSSGETISKNYYINIDSSWKKQHCKAIVFVTNANTKEVIQVNEIDL